METVTPSKLLGLSRQATLVCGVTLGLLGMVHWGLVLEAGLTIASITYGSLLGVFLLGIWNRNATENGAIIGMLTGLSSMIAIKFDTPLAWTWYVLAGTVLTFGAGSLASYLMPGSGHRDLSKASQQ